MGKRRNQARGAILSPGRRLQPRAVEAALAPRGNPDKAADALLTICPKGLIKVGTIDPKVDGSAPKMRCFTAPADRDAMRGFIAAHDGKRNVYFEIGVPREKLNRRSKESDVAFSRFVAVDCDPLPGESADDAKKRHAKLLASGVVPPPTFQWESGNGTVALWKREKSIRLDSPEAVAEAKGASAAMAQALGGKANGIDHCHSQEHLLRVPYTVNIPDRRKLAKGRKVELAGAFQGDARRPYGSTDWDSPDGRSRPCNGRRGPRGSGRPWRTSDQ